MADLENARIDQLPQSAGPTPGSFLAMRNMVTGVTERIEVDYFLNATNTQNFEWQSDTEYDEDDVVTWGGTWWQALQDVPENIVPGTDPTMWLSIPRSASGFVYWEAGVFVEDDVFVLRVLDQFVQIFRLVAVARPYTSADFETEFVSGDWELMSERGYVGIAKTTHGFAVNDVLTYKSGAWNKFVDGDTPLAIVRVVESANLVIVVLLGNRLKGLSGLTAGSTYYAQNDATISTVESDSPLFLAVSTTEGILLAAGGGGSSPFLGVFASEAALTSAFPDADPGNYAYVDPDGSTDAKLYIWDDDNADWIFVGDITVSIWNTTTPGTVERSTTGEAQNIVTRAAAGSSNSSNDDGRTPSEKGLVEMLLSFLGTAWTWTLAQTFTIGPTISDATLSTPAWFNASKKLVTAVVTDFLVWLGWYPANVVITNGATGTTNLDCLSARVINFEYNTTVTGAVAITKSNDSNLTEYSIVMPVNTGGIEVEFPSDTRAPKYMEVTTGNGWYQSTKKLKIASVVNADLWEFNLRKKGSVFLLVWDGPFRP